MKYILSKKYETPELMEKIMGPNPIKLEEELMLGNKIPDGSVVCDLGSGRGLTSVFLAKEYGFKVYAADLWSNPEENKKFFESMGLTEEQIIPVKEYGFKVYAADLWSNPEENKKFFESRGLTEEQIIPVKADAENLPFEKDFFDAVVTTDSYNYFGRNSGYLDEKLLPFVKSGGYIYISIPGMKKDCHDELPKELLLSWTPEQLDYMHDAAYWKATVEQCVGAELIEIGEMESNDEVWADWLKQDNEYAVGDRKSMEAGGGKYLNFIKIVLRKK